MKGLRDLSLIGFAVSYLAACSLIENSVDSTFTQVEGETLYLSGTMNSRTYDELARVLSDNPQLRTVEIGVIDGSVDDDTNLKTGLLIHEAGLNTFLRSDSFIESGGVDIFCAGRERRAEPGAHVGVHAWAYNDNDQSGDTFAADDPAHEPYIQYFETVGCPVSFYWFTIEASPAHDMYVMTRDELIEQGVVTEFVEPR